MSEAYRAFGLLLAQVWGEGVDNRVMRPLGGPESRGLMLAADHHGQRHVLAPVSDERAFQEQRGETLTLTEWTHQDQRYLDLGCSSESLAHVFANLADDVRRRIEEKEEEPSDALLAAVAEWRRLFKPAKALDESRARGLFGELQVLKWLVQRNAQYALDCWSGPEAETHDFTSPNGDLEIKSGASGLDIQVSSLDQLDPQPDRPLVLIRMPVTTSPNGQNIAQIADELCAAGVVRSELVAKLGNAGFLLGQDPDVHRFTVAGPPAVWVVGADFPGLRASDIPPSRLGAIRAVKYTLDLVAAPEPMTRTELDSYLDQMVQT